MRLPIGYINYETFHSTDRICAVLLLAGAGSAWAQGDAKDLYLSKCATCHGPDGAGKTAMGKKLKVKDVHETAAKMSADDMIKIVTDGKGQDMDAYGKQFKPGPDQRAGRLLSRSGEVANRRLQCRRLSLLLFCLAAALVALLVGFRVELTRSREGKMLAFVALFALPVMAAWTGFSEQMDRATSTQFCLSCHVMDDFGRTLYIDDPSYIPARHFQNNRIPRDHACYTCHTEYTMFGGVKAKARGCGICGCNTSAALPNRKPSSCTIPLTTASASTAIWARAVSRKARRTTRFPIC